MGFLLGFNLWKYNYLLDVLGAPQQLKQIASITQLTEAAHLGRLRWSRELHGLDGFKTSAIFLDF